ncbi:hypothetical protein [Streptomyces sp. NPDC058861]|uniref:hypothetical protein n=1 Tax=Streptomyces sp. NPDC058861 TaxID=3346653 RepID=UPI0036ABCEC6
MQMIDLREQARRLGTLPKELDNLADEVDRVRAGEISLPVREIAPLAVWAGGLSIRCLLFLDILADSQYAVMKDGAEALADMAETCVQVNTASCLCSDAITGRTDALIYKDADETAETARARLGEASTELRAAADRYRGFTRTLTLRLASSVTRAEDRRLIEAALTGRAKAQGKAGAVPSPAVAPEQTAARRSR